MMNPFDKKVSKFVSEVKIPRFGKDSDGDGVPNILDCKPYDKNRQGVVHDIKRDVGGYVKQKRMQWRQRVVAKRQIEDKARSEYYQAKEIEDVRAAREKARIEADRKIQYYKSGGFLGQVNRGVSQIGKGIDKIAKPRAPVRTATRKRKKAKRKTKTRNRSKMVDDFPKLDFGF